jgi:hypothetical protein
MNVRSGLEAVIALPRDLVGLTGHGSETFIRSGPFKYNIVKSSVAMVHCPAAIAAQFGIALHLAGA